MLFSLANQFNTYTSPLFLQAGFGSSVLNGTRHSYIVLLTYSEDKKCLRWNKQPYPDLIANRLGQHTRKSQWTAYYENNTMAQYVKTPWFHLVIKRQLYFTESVKTDSQREFGNPPPIYESSTTQNCKGKSHLCLTLIPGFSRAWMSLSQQMSVG